MADVIAVLTPAYRAEGWIGACVASVLGQDWPHWEHWIVADDGVDYETLLAAAGLRDPRQRFLATGGRGDAALARNLGLDAIGAPCVATLDADDRFKPGKLAQVARALRHHGIVSVALDDIDESGRHLRFVGNGPDRELSPAIYKWTNLSMDSMIAWDRRRTDARYDPSLPNMSDLDLLLQLFRTVPACWHLGTPLHDYLKLGQSLSNGTGVTARMVHAKTEMLRRLDAGLYPMADARGVEGMARFLEISLGAEKTYPAALAAHAGLLFEDHLEPLLRG